MINLLVRIATISPAFRRFLWHRWYQYLAGIEVRDWVFMNYGFEDPQGNTPRLELKPEDERNRYCIQLYHRVASAIDLKVKTIVEVGCGRGGGSSFVFRYLQPKQMTSIDFSRKAIRFCQAQHKHPGLTFERGDAENLPLKDASCDAVLNVESSHCYGSMPKFLSEVARVLKPGGHFLFADFRVPEDAQKLTSLFSAAGLRVIEHENITPGVLHALTLDSRRKLEQLEKHAPKRWLKTLKRFAAIEGSDVYSHFENGTFIYDRYLLQKVA